MNEPLSCAKCGAPRTVSACNYCGTRYSVSSGGPQIVDPTLMVRYRDMPGAREVSEALQREMAERGLHYSGYALKHLIQYARATNSTF
jgi:hypothetical protein